MGSNHYKQRGLPKKINARRVCSLVGSAGLACLVYLHLFNLFYPSTTSTTSHATIMGDKAANVDQRAWHSSKAAVVQPTPAITESLTEVPRLPKVALLFLTAGDVPHEKLWEEWLAGGRLITAQALCNITTGSGTGQNTDSNSGCSLYSNTMSIQQVSGPDIFSVYVHAPLAYEFPSGTFFGKYVIEERLKTRWGDHSLVAAAKALLRQALKDPLNTWFILVSETDVPLYGPALTWLQLQSQNRSHINACPGDPYVTMLRRWSPRMETPFLKSHHWRKSNQFFALTRSHASIVTEDSEVDLVFARYCYFGYDPWLNRTRDCVSDEHYIATLMATKGLEKEMNCDSWGISMMCWEGGKAHPKSFVTNEVSKELIWQFRGQEKEAVVAAEQSIDTTLQMLLKEAQRKGGLHFENFSVGVQNVFKALPDTAKLTARKFIAPTANDVYALFASEDCGDFENLNVLTKAGAGAGQKGCNLSSKTSKE